MGCPLKCCFCDETFSEVLLFFSRIFTLRRVLSSQHCYKSFWGVHTGGQKGESEIQNIRNSEIFGINDATYFLEVSQPKKNHSSSALENFQNITEFIYEVYPGNPQKFEISWTYFNSRLFSGCLLIPSNKERFRNNFKLRNKARLMLFINIFRIFTIYLLHKIALSFLHKMLFSS